MSNPGSEEGVYDFAPDVDAPSEPKPSRRAVSNPDQPINAPTVLPYRSGREDKPKPLETDEIKHVYLPLGLLGGGILVEILSAIIWTHQVRGTFIELALDLTVGTAVMLLAMVIAAKIRGIELGKLHVAAYKLAAISIAPVAITEFISPIARFIPLGGLILLLVQFVLFFALLGALFDLDESDTWYCVMIMVVTRIAIFVGLSVMFR